MGGAGALCEGGEGVAEEDIDGLGSGWDVLVRSLLVFI